MLAMCCDMTHAGFYCSALHAITNKYLVYNPALPTQEKHTWAAFRYTGALVIMRSGLAL